MGRDPVGLEQSLNAHGVAHEHGLLDAGRFQQLDHVARQTLDGEVLLLQLVAEQARRAR